MCSIRYPSMYFLFGEKKRLNTFFLQVLVRNSGIHIMVSHLYASSFVIKCLYLAARTNRLVSELFTTESLTLIVRFYSQTKNSVCLKLLRVLIQPTPLDKPLRVMQNHICALLLHPQYNLFGNARDLIAAELGNQKRRRKARSKH